MRKCASKPWRCALRRSVLAFLTIAAWQTAAHAGEARLDKPARPVARAETVATAPAAPPVPADPTAKTESAAAGSGDSTAGPAASPLDSRGNSGIRLIRYGHSRRLYGVY